MKNAFLQFRKHWLTNLIVFLSSLVVGGIIFILYFFLRNRVFIDAVNGSMIAAAFVILSAFHPPKLKENNNYGNIQLRAI